VIFFCNFYGNTVSSTGGILYGENVGMEVQTCIFNGNGPTIGMKSAPKAAADKFSLSLCVFSGPIPTVTGGLVTSPDNYYNSVTASFNMQHLTTYYCPTASPTCSRSPTRSRSLAATPTKAQTANQPSDSPRPTDTNSVSETPTSTISFSPTPTISETWHCELYEQVNSRLISYSVFCVDIESSVFVGTSDAFGGGICIWNKLPTVNICLCTFYECEASSGGGIDYSGSNLTILSCCFRNTSSIDRGTAISFSDGSGWISVGEVNFVECHDVDGSASGTLRISTNFICSYHLLNFTSCCLSYSNDFSVGDGSILEFSDSDGNFSFSSCTIVGCIGRSGIRNRCDNDCYVCFINFYNNSFWSFSGVLSCERRGLIVDTCIFHDNTNELILDDSSEIGFIISNCVFSSDLPNGSYYLSTTNNIFNTKTISLYFAHFATSFCPAAASFPSQTNPFTGSSCRYRSIGHIVQALIFSFLYGR
jgi:hypothetical protein